GNGDRWSGPQAPPPCSAARAAAGAGDERPHRPQPAARRHGSSARPGSPERPAGRGAGGRAAGAVRAAAPAGRHLPAQAAALGRRVANAKERERIKNLNRGFAKLKALVPFLPQSRKPSKVDILKGATEYIQVLSDVLEGAKDSERQNLDHQSYSNNVSEPPISLARGLSRNITQHASCTVGLKNEEERPWADGGSGESAHTCRQSMMSTTGVISPTRSLSTFGRLNSCCYYLSRLGMTGNKNCCCWELKYEANCGLLVGIYLPQSLAPPPSLGSVGGGKVTLDNMSNHAAIQPTTGARLPYQRG
uniref:BHLH domain-containing protein n=1 Tax=Felis catus TaxID=9685 RepID=A0ABI7XM50_FELCA